MINVTRKITKNTKNNSFAIPADATAIPVNPKIAAKIAITRKASAHPSIFF